jgi:hypothetical protein
VRAAGGANGQAKLGKETPTPGPFGGQVELIGASLPLAPDPPRVALNCAARSIGPLRSVIPLLNTAGSTTR